MVREAGAPAPTARSEAGYENVGTAGRRARTSRTRCFRPYGGEPPEETSLLSSAEVAPRSQEPGLPFLAAPPSDA